MANNNAGNQGGGSKKSAGYVFPDALKEAGQKAAELAQNPVARSMLAAGLVAAAAALTANARVRKTVVDAGRDALDSAEAAADSATKIGAAIVTAATEAVRKLMPGIDQEMKTSAGGQAAAKPASRSRAKAANGASARSAATKSKSAKPAAKAAPSAKAAATTSGDRSRSGASGSAGSSAKAPKAAAKPAAKKGAAKSGGRARKTAPAPGAGAE